MLCASDMQMIASSSCINVEICTHAMHAADSAQFEKHAMTGSQPTTIFKEQVCLYMLTPHVI